MPSMKAISLTLKSGLPLFFARFNCLSIDYQLERLQRRRKGEPQPPTVNVNVSSDDDD